MCKNGLHIYINYFWVLFGIFSRLCMKNLSIKKRRINLHIYTDHDHIFMLQKESISFVTSWPSALAKRLFTSENGEVFTDRNHRQNLQPDFINFHIFLQSGYNAIILTQNNGETKLHISFWICFGTSQKDYWKQLTQGFAILE